MGVILSSERIRTIEKKNIECYGIGADVLMERAGACVARVIQNEFPECDTPILVMCGCGNNGADGLVAARILSENGYPVSLYIREGNKSELFNKNLSIINCISADLGEVCEILTDEAEILDEYDVCIDALFGTGINRPLSNDDSYLVNLINDLNCTVVSVDVPSGLNASTGEIYNVCVNADITVSFAAYKLGQLIKMGPDYCGDVRVFDIGLWYNCDLKSDYFFIEHEDISETSIFHKATANKGTYGKTLIIAGSKDVYGACYLSGKAAIISGAGLVKFYTHINNKQLLNSEFPEGLVSTYDSCVDVADLNSNVKWADTVLIGPGLGIFDVSYSIFTEIINCVDLNGKLLIVDADGINLLSMHKDLLDTLLEKSTNGEIKIVMTPHKKELRGLMSKFDITDEEMFGKFLFSKFKVCLINKDSKTRIYGDKNYINLTGNEGMATAGSGDVLAGILSGLIFRLETDDFTKAVALSVHLHGLCGDMAKERVGAVSMTATDILNAIPKALDFLT